MTISDGQASARQPRATGLAVAGVAWIGIAATFVYLGLATPLLGLLLFSGSARGTSAEHLATAFCLAVVPVAWSVAGVARLRSAARLLRRRETSALRSLASRLAPPARVLGPVWLPSGRAIPEVLVAPQGVVVVRELPRGVYRTVGGRWEVIGAMGGMSCESPLEAAARDAEAIRHYLASSELDFAVRVHTVVVADEDLERIGGCALVRPSTLEAFIAALPPQRSMSDPRIETIVALLGGGTQAHTAAR